MPCARSRSSSTSKGKIPVSSSVSRSVYSSPTPSQFPSTSSQGDKVPCPFKGYDGCGGGVCGRGYAKSAIYRHISDQHFPTEKEKQICREHIHNNPDCFAAWENVLFAMQMWLCMKCLRIHAWRKTCTSELHKADVIAGLFNGNGADFLIHGVSKPQAVSSYDSAVESGNTGDNDAVVGLSLDMLNTVFQRRITTTASVPPPCRLQFSRALKSSLDLVIAQPDNLQAWLQLLLLPACTLNRYVPSCTSEERSGTRKKLQITAINQSLCTWREPNGCAALVHKILGLSKPSTAVSKPAKEKKKVSANFSACKKKISHGHYTAAIRVLSSDGMAPASPETLQDLILKHPPAPPPSLSVRDNSTPALTVDTSAVLSAIKSFPKGTSCGRDGLRSQHLLDAFSGAAAAISDELLQSITGVVNLWLNGRCPSSLGEFITSTPLTPLLKPGGGIRPIAVGTIWCRLCSKLAATSVCKQLSSYLGDFQFGVGTPCGGEGILHAANKLLELKGNCATQTMMLVDFRMLSIWSTGQPCLKKLVYIVLTSLNGRVLLLAPC
ncbi:uncharacterized protein LOC113305438 isoform X1 [Papaver somniferum]|uniref:uncharacterized protein LOC113305438 isoform X1 n=1 Tax=Papaver somniferum TaxID=3469 RepID=UPI000E6F8BF5|nr:uncharacterized protein LOC113305438 isoform X1 [Papaver somniferum]XP_026410261.1 uncharacterized protein LOC113305438 isoform X1 [Papaver somniferum]